MTRAESAGLSIVLVTPRYLPDAGGAGVYTAMLANFLRSQDRVHRVAVLTPAARGKPRRERDGKLTVYRLLPSRTEGWRGLPSVRLLSRPLTDLIILGTLVVLVLRGGYQVVHVHGNFAWVGGRVPNVALETVIRLLGVHGVLDLRGPDTRPRRSEAWRSIICASRDIWNRALASGIPAERCHYVPTPIDVEAIRRTARAASERVRMVTTGGPYLCYVGELTALKGIPELLEAFKVVANGQSNGGLRLVMVGPLVPRSGEELGWPSRFKQDRNVVYLGPRPWEEGLAILAGAELVVVPSRAHTEGFPRVLLEALALGRKVIVGAGVQEFAEVCPEYVIPAAGVTPLARALSDALARRIPPQYDLSVHDAAAALPRYLTIYGSSSASTAPHLGSLKG